MLCLARSLCWNRTTWNFCEHSSKCNHLCENFVCEHLKKQVNWSCTFATCLVDLATYFWTIQYQRSKRDNYIWKRNQNQSSKGHNPLLGMNSRGPKKGRGSHGPLIKTYTEINNRANVAIFGVFFVANTWFDGM